MQWTVPLHKEEHNAQSVDNQVGLGEIGSRQADEWPETHELYIQEATKLQT